jgi:hypothetical protein
MLKQGESKFTHQYVKINQDEYISILLMTLYFEFRWLLVNAKAVI